jgi:hypothetical protein
MPRFPSRPPNEMARTTYNKDVHVSSKSTHGGASETYLGRRQVARIDSPLLLSQLAKQDLLRLGWQLQHLLDILGEQQSNLKLIHGTQNGLMRYPLSSSALEDKVLLTLEEQQRS